MRPRKTYQRTSIDRTGISDCFVTRRNGMWEYRVHFYERGSIPVIILSPARLPLPAALEAAVRAA